MSSHKVLRLHVGEGQAANFLLKREIHGELGSVHAMNFGRNLKYLEVWSDSEVASGAGHELLQLITARIGPAS